MSRKSKKRKYVRVAQEERELSRTKKRNVAEERKAGSQLVEPVGNALLPRPNSNAGPQPVELDAELQQPSSSAAGTSRVQAEQLVPDSNAAETPVVYPDEEANNLRHLAALTKILIPGSETDERILSFIQNLRQAKIENDVLTVPGGAYLGGISDLKFLHGKMLVRQCYRDLKNQMINRCESQLRADANPNQYLVMGNPGIGKSLFSYYLLYMLMHLKKTIVWQPLNSTQAVCITPTTISFADNIRAFQVHLLQASTWYIVDGRRPDTFDAITILVTSPDYSTWKDFAKRNALKRYMPIWTDEEIKMVKPRGMALALSDSGYQELEDSVINERYRIWGGIPRFVFQNSFENDDKRAMEQVINDMDVEHLHRYVGMTHARDVRHQVMHMIVTIDCAEADRYKRYVMGFASEFARKLVLKQTLQWNHEKVKEFISSVSGESTAAVFRGMLFETYAHQIMCSGREFIVRKLDGTAPNDQEPFPVKFGKGKLTLKKFEDVSKIKEPENWKDYFVPTSTNYPSIDSLLYPNCLFQMTVASDHTINVDGLKKVVGDMLARRKRAAPAEKNIRFYFVVREDKFKFFEQQKYTDDEPTFPRGVRVDQYVLQTDLQLSFFGEG